MIEVEHPGVMLKQDFLDDLEIKPGALAKNIGVDRSAIKKFMKATAVSVLKCPYDWGCFLA